MYKFSINSVVMRIEKITTGFIEVPNLITINVYANGCRIKCDGCSNPQLQSFDGGTDMNIKELKNQISKYDTLSKTICWLGGDATFQQEEFIKFNRELKRAGYTIVLFTGRYFESIRDFLVDVDLVIDGPWQGKTISDEGTNQRIFIRRDGLWNNVSYETLKQLTKEKRKC